MSLLCSKLTLKLQTKWEDLHAQAADPTAHPTFNELSKYLDVEKNTLYLIESKQEKKSKTHQPPDNFKNDKSASNKVKKSSNLLQNKEKKPDCPICNGNHFNTRCETFLSKTLSVKRKQLPSQKHLCFNCLGKHQIAECKSN